jgi:hypothetical protein
VFIRRTDNGTVRGFVYINQTTNLVDGEVILRNMELIPRYSPADTPPSSPEPALYLSEAHGTEPVEGSKPDKTDFPFCQAHYSRSGKLRE